MHCQLLQTEPLGVQDASCELGELILYNDDLLPVCIVLCRVLLYLMRRGNEVARPGVARKMVHPKC